MKPELPLAPPSRAAIALEARVFLDLVKMGSPLIRSYRLRMEQTRHQRVMVVPGFGAGDNYTWPLRKVLSHLGFEVLGWGLGVNKAGLDIPHTLADLHPRWKFEPKDEYRREGGVPYVIDRLIERVESVAAQSDQPIALVGWSLGGLMAREVAREMPHAISQVITMGTPVVGGPKYTMAVNAFKERNCDVDWIEQGVALRDENPIQVPITALVSPTDGVVSYGAAIDRNSPLVEHINIDVSHLAFPYSTKVWDIVQDKLLSLEPEHLAS